ncbi:hypothetical protein QE250_12240 [Chromatiaceae bacterium AAb-1]|nr:hypothetical protein [Chromatiaceae bacterium AAb-1]
MSSMPQSRNISNCIKAPFDPVDKVSPGDWSICYNQQQNVLTLAVQQNHLGTMKESHLLVSTIDADGLSEMIDFLAHIQMRMQKPAQK